MLFFLDTADIDKIIFWKKKGLVDGITTNPTLLSKNGNEPTKVLKEICKIVKGDVSAQVTFTRTKEMVEQAFFLKSLAKNIVIKLPCTLDGIDAARILAKKNLKINITLGFDPSQLGIFQKIDIKYFSFIIGKVEDHGLSNLDNLRHMKLLIKKVNKKIKLLCASIRNEKHLIHAIINDADVLTVPPSTWEKIYSNKFSLQGEKDFLNAFNLLSPELRKKYQTKKSINKILI
jgi:transaldolase